MTPAREVAASYFLEASAGTGKTTQLISHIVRCIGAETKLERIVAVTFTHAAAGEVKLRLREELGKARQSAADLELAFVGTIHSFCARLLRERPVEAGVDPRFVELDEQGAVGLFAVVFRRWVERRLSEPSPTLRRAITRLAWRDDGEGRDPLASLRKAAWSLVEWRDHPAPWTHRGHPGMIFDQNQGSARSSGNIDRSRRHRHCPAKILCYIRARVPTPPRRFIRTGS